MLRAALDQSADHIAQRTQGQIDFLSLFHPVSGSAGFAEPLAAGQVYQVEPTGSVLP